MQTKTLLTQSLGAIADTDAHASGGADLEGAIAHSVTLKWASGSTPVGTFKLQCADAEDPGSADWVDLTPTGSISGNTGILNIHDGEAAYRWVRAVVTLASGSATFTVTINRKG